jgi:type II secretory pathway pseudopilin PulG
MNGHPQGLRCRSQHQRGVTLVIALILLGAMGLLAAWALRNGTTNLRTVHNQQMRQEALAAAQAAVERTISSSQFMLDPVTAAAQPVEVDIDGDGQTDLRASLTPAPRCFRSRTVTGQELDPMSERDRPCLSSSSSGSTGIETTPSGRPTGTLCVDNEWNVRATVTDPDSGAVMTLNQGVSLRGLVSDADGACPP